MAKKQQMSPGNLAWSLVEPWWKHINIYRGPAVFRKSLRLVPEEVANLYAVHFCDSEVLNGGFLQFYMNSTGVLATEALRGLRALGLTEAAKVLARTMRRFGKEYSRGKSARWRKLCRNSTSIRLINILSRKRMIDITSCCRMTRCV